MSIAQQLAFLDATAQADLVRRGEVKSIELVEAAITRIEEVNPGLNAVVTPMFDEARAIAQGELPQATFTGVPFLLKDLLATYKGVPLTFGSPFSGGYVPDHDSKLVSRLKRAGLIIVGKTNTPEFGILPTTEPALFGAARNPWDTNRTTGGSSGGSAAAVAAGLVPMAHANDGGGSIRIPAACCGLFGMKPTRGRNPLGPDFGDMYSGLICEHAVTRSVRDSAALLDATSGPDIGDPYYAPPPARPFLQEVGADPGRLRIAFNTAAPTGVPVHEDCVAAVTEAAKLCEELGHSVTEAAPSVNAEKLMGSFMTIWSAGCKWTVDGFAKPSGRPVEAGAVEPLTLALYQMGARRSASDYLLALQRVQKTSRQVARFFEDYDIWLTPTLAQPPLPLGSFDSPAEDPMRGMKISAEFAPFTAICNMTGQPAMSLPLFWNVEGLPVGTHFVGRFGDEATLFRLAGQLETARPWGGRRPPVSA